MVTERFRCICGHSDEDHVDEGVAPCRVEGCICREYLDESEAEAE